MTAKKAAASAERRAEVANGENTPKKHALTPEMEVRKWKPGQSGNPGGRPKRDRASELAILIMEAASQPQNAAAIVKAMLKKFRKGDAKSFETIASRGYGKPHQQIDVTGQMNVSVVIDL